MATGYALEQVGVLDGTKNPPALADGRVVGGRMLLFQATFDLSKTTVAKNNGDNNVCFVCPGDCHPVAFMFLASATMGAAATIAVGNATTPAKYKGAATFTTPDTPTWFMLSSAADDPPLSDPETVIMTIGAAALPGAGILQIFMLASKV
jgi:hypothetical protein